MCAMTYKITDAIENADNIRYIADNISLGCSLLGFVCDIDMSTDRATVYVTSSSGEQEKLKLDHIIGMIAEVISVNYKYRYLKSRLGSLGLNEVDNELLLAAVISSDYYEESDYIYNSIRNYNGKGEDGVAEISIDGNFNFRLRPLLEKWQKCLYFLPEDFAGYSLEDYISSIVVSHDSRTCVINPDGSIGCINNRISDEVYDQHGLGKLMGKIPYGELTREVLLTTCNEVKVYCNIPAEDKKYLRKFFGRKISFNNR